MKKYRLTLKNSQAIVPGDDISRHDSFRLAPAPRPALDEETRGFDLSAIERSLRDDGREQRNKGKEKGGCRHASANVKRRVTVEIPTGDGAPTYHVFRGTPPFLRSIGLVFSTRRRILGTCNKRANC